ncbi:MAG: hypothetical protein M3P53_00765 [Actinomycetota bacterium]|nr:hypothetical protein [Actinomycetota bacterium]
MKAGALLPIARYGDLVPAVVRVARLSPSSRFSELVDGWLFQLGATKQAANTLAGYRRTWRVWPGASPPTPRWLCCTSST